MWNQMLVWTGKTQRVSSAPCRQDKATTCRLFSQQISGSVFSVNICSVFGSQLSAWIFLPFTQVFVVSEPKVEATTAWKDDVFMFPNQHSLIYNHLFVSNVSFSLAFSLPLLKGLTEGVKHHVDFRVPLITEQRCFVRWVGNWFTFMQ